MEETIKEDYLSGLDICVEGTILVFRKWYMNGNWREEDLEDDNKCLESMDT